MIFGRQQELASLNAAYEHMLAGHGSVVFLTGEAGLGKTTLVHEWWADTRQKEKGKRQNGETQEQETGNKKSEEESASPFLLLPFALFLESACSIPIGNVDVGQLESLQPWADIISRISDVGFGISDNGSRNADLGFGISTGALIPKKIERQLCFR